MTVRATGGIEGITLGGPEHADFLAGVDVTQGGAPGVSRHADDPADFVNALAGIGSFTIKPSKTLPPDTPMFVNSNVSGATTAKVTIFNADFANGGTQFGFWAKNTGTGKEMGSVKHTDLSDPSNNWTWPKQPVSPGDLAIDAIRHPCGMPPAAEGPCLLLTAPGAAVPSIT